MNAKLAFEFIGNAGGIFIGKEGSRILCDPWLVDGVFEGSWCHYPKLKTTIDDVKDVDAVYVSHLHPDHFDERFFDFDKGMPLLVLDHGPNFLIKKLQSLGFSNLRTIKDKGTISFREFEITMFAPFTKHNFHDAIVGNLIDSAMLISCDDVVALNANDNTPTIESAEIIKREYGPISLAMLNYNAAGPYPSCFDNLSEEEKLAEHRRILERNFKLVQDIVLSMEPKYVLPFAGAYVLGGDLHHKNKYLGTTTWDECGEWLSKAGIGSSEVVLLREGDSFNIESGVSDKEYIPIDQLEMKRYIESDLAKMRYPYQTENFPDKDTLVRDIEGASILMAERMRKYGIDSKFSVFLKVDEDMLRVYPSFLKLREVDEAENKLICEMDVRLLRNIMDRKSHWNNAEVGAHISLNRSPDCYEPDLHTGLQFFHL
jgi:UDP-MurNAc hydroxylase